MLQMLFYILQLHFRGSCFRWDDEKKTFSLQSAAFELIPLESQEAISHPNEHFIMVVLISRIPMAH